MAITAKFQADFSDFHKGVQEADAKLKTFSTSATKVGDDVTQLALVTERGVHPFNNLRGSLQQFDGALAAAGVHLGPEIRALGELGDVAGKSAKDVGLLGVAGLAVGAALGGWKIGRMVSEFFGLDQAIGNATAKLLGFGDVAAQTAGAKADVLARATATAKREITDYTEAIRINAEAVKSRTAVAVAGAERETAAGKARADWLKKALAEEAADAKKLADLQDHLFGRDLVEKARSYAEALGGVNNVSKLIPSVQAEMNKAFGAAYDALVTAGKGASAAAIEYDKLRTATTNWAAINAQLAAMPDPFAANTKQRQEAFRETEVAILNQGLILDGSAEYWQHAGEIADAEMAKTKAAVETIAPAADASASRMNSSFSMAFANIGTDAESAAARVTAALHLADTNKQNSGNFGPSFGTADSINRMAERNAGLVLRSYGTGGPVTRDGPIYAHAGEYVLPKGGEGGATGTTVYATITITGQGAHAGREAADALAARLKQTGRRI